MCLSLIKYQPEINIWVLCMDTYSERILKKLKLKNVTIITLAEFEDNLLRKAKKNRTSTEYYWTCTPSLPLYVFRKNKLATHVVYVDADIFFYDKLTPILEELGDSSIYMVEHRFPISQRQREDTSGRFNVGILIFKRDNEALECLKTWRRDCIKWCYWREEDGKMGDQLYLNEWPAKFKGVVISQNLGIDAAPWNINQYRIRPLGNKVFINNDKLICYHFHQFKILGPNKFSLCSRFLYPFYEYHLSAQVKDIIYNPYISNIRQSILKIFHLDPGFNYFEKRYFMAVPNIKVILSKHIKGN